MASLLERQSVYFIQAGESGPVKIGISGDVDARLRQLQKGSHETLYLLGTLNGGVRDEQALHAEFGHLRIRSEWFKPSAAMLMKIRPMTGLAAERLGRMFGLDTPEKRLAFQLDRHPDILAEIERLSV